MKAFLIICSHPPLSYSFLWPLAETDTELKQMTQFHNDYTGTVWQFPSPSSPVCPVAVSC